MARDGYEYGKTTWEIKIPQHKAHQAPTDSNSSVKVGVMSKHGKFGIIHGGLVNYGLSTEAINIKLSLDVESRTLAIQNGNSKNPEIISNLPSGALYPVFQNKTSRDCSAHLIMNVSFDLAYCINE